MSILKFFKKAASPAIVPEDKGTDSEREEEPVLTASGKVDLVTQSLGDCDSPSNESTGPPAAKRQGLSSDRDCGDVASVIGNQIVNADHRYNLLVNHFKPGADYSFPKQANGRSFQLRWLQLLPWLVYIKHANVFPVFCLLQVITMGPIPVYL